MGNMSKFIMTGAFAVASSIGTNNALANDAPQVNFSVSQSTPKNLHPVAKSIIKEINPFLMRQYESGVLTERVTKTFINVKDPSSNKKLKNSLHSENDQQCEANLSYTSNGDVVGIPIKFTNEQQKEMYRKLVAAHEFSHCDFLTIKELGNFGTDVERNEYVMKGMKVRSELEIIDKSSYNGTLNENFADVNAAVALIKEYGPENENLKEVFRVVKEERERTFKNVQFDIHFTHDSMEEVLKPENMQKIASTNDPKELRKLVIDIAKTGTAKAFYQKPEMIDKTLSDDSLIMATAFESLSQLYDRDLSVKPNNSKNIISDFASVVVKNMEAEKKSKIKLPTNEKETMAIVGSVYGHISQNENKYANFFKDYRDTMKELKENIQVVATAEKQDTFTPKTNQEAAFNIAKLRKQFLEDNARLDNESTFPLKPSFK